MNSNDAYMDNLWYHEDRVRDVFYKAKMIARIPMDAEDASAFQNFMQEVHSCVHDMVRDLDLTASDVKFLKEDVQKLQSEGLLGEKNKEIELLKEKLKDQSAETLAIDNIYKGLLKQRDALFRDYGVTCTDDLKKFITRAVKDSLNLANELLETKLKLSDAEEHFIQMESTYDAMLQAVASDVDSLLLDKRLSSTS
jgi:hypothetical protein